MSQQAKIYHDLYSGKITKSKAIEGLRALGLNKAADMVLHTFED